MQLLRNFGYLLKDVSRMSSMNFERHATALNLTMAQCKVLIYLQRNQGISQVRLAYLTDTDPMTLVRILDRMERDGWIERRADPADRRARRLYLLEAAEPLVAEILAIADRARAEALAGLSEAECEQMMNLLERVHGNLSSLFAGTAEADRPGILRPRPDAGPEPPPGLAAAPVRAQATPKATARNRK